MEQELSSSVICPILKKRDQTRGNNYRVILLLDSAYNSAYKVLSMAILRWIGALTINIVEKYQCGFTKGRSTSFLTKNRIAIDYLMSKILQIITYTLSYPRSETIVPIASTRTERTALVVHSQIAQEKTFTLEMW